MVRIPVVFGRRRGITMSQVEAAIASALEEESGVTDHGALTGLTDNDHPQYALATALTTHEGAADPHAGYLQESVLPTKGSLATRGTAPYRAPQSASTNASGGNINATFDQGAAQTGGTYSQFSNGTVSGLWLRFNFAAPVEVGFTRMFMHSYCNASWVLESTDDATNGPWTLRHTMTPAPAGGDSGVVALDTPGTARYWRWTTTSSPGNQWTIEEAALFGSAGPATLAAGSNGQVVLYDSAVDHGLRAWGGHQTLTDGATINWNAQTNPNAQVTLGGNRTLAAPTNLFPGQRYSLRVIQDATGSRTLTWNSVFKFRAPPTLQTAASAVDQFDFYCPDGTNLYEITPYGAMAVHGAQSDPHTAYLRKSALTARGSLLVGLAASTTNVALSSLLGTGAFSASGGGPATNTYIAFDGNDGTEIQGSPSSGFGAGSWVRADLGQPQAIVSWRVYQFASMYWKIQSSTDNVEWTDRYVQSTYGPQDSGEVVLSGAPITARYWRILILAAVDFNTTWALRSFELRTGVPLGTPGEHPAGSNGQFPVWDSAATNGVRAYGGHQTLTDAATVNWNAATAAGAQVTLGGNRTLAAPTGLLPGQRYVLHVIQDATGSRTLTWNAVFKFPGATAPTLSTAAGARDIFEFYSDGTNLYLTSQTLDVR